MRYGLTYLRVKIKALAAEAKIIRHEETRAKKWKRTELLCGLHNHRVLDVRSAARETLLAYGYLRGYAYDQLEHKCDIPPNWTAVEKMVVKYGAERADMPVKSWKDGKMKLSA